MPGAVNAAETARTEVVVTTPALTTGVANEAETASIAGVTTDPALTAGAAKAADPARTEVVMLTLVPPTVFSVTIHAVVL